MVYKSHLYRNLNFVMILAGFWAQTQTQTSIYYLDSCLVFLCIFNLSTLTAEYSHWSHAELLQAPSSFEVYLLNINTGHMGI